MEAFILLPFRRHWVQADLWPTLHPQRWLDWNRSVNRVCLRIRTPRSLRVLLPPATAPQDLPAQDRSRRRPRPPSKRRRLRLRQWRRPDCHRLRRRLILCLIRLLLTTHSCLTILTTTTQDWDWLRRHLRRLKAWPDCRPTTRIIRIIRTTSHPCRVASLTPPTILTRLPITIRPCGCIRQWRLFRRLLLLPPHLRARQDQEEEPGLEEPDRLRRRHSRSDWEPRHSLLLPPPPGDLTPIFRHRLFRLLVPPPRPPPPPPRRWVCHPL